MEPMNRVILMRAGLAEEAELKAAEKYFEVFTSRSVVPPHAVVIGRYSVLPYYGELVTDLKAMDSDLINGFAQHKYIADLKNWYQDLEGLTPRTFFSLEEYYKAVEDPDNFSAHKPVVLKGKTNSLKNLWHTHMFARMGKQSVPEIYRNLRQDSLVGDQDVYIREFVTFRAYDDVHAVGGAPVTDEYRFFILDGQIIASGFYWSEHEELVAELHFCNAAKVPVPASATRFVKEEVIPKIKDKVRFVVVDVGRLRPRPDSLWTVVELNDGQMSGLSGCDAETLYKNMSAVLRGYTLS